MKRALIVILKVAIPVALIAWLLESGKIDLSDLSRVHGFGWLLLAQLLVLSMISLTFFRWYLLLRAQGIRYSFREIAMLGFIGFFFNQFMLGSTGGDLVKAYYVAVEQPRNRAAAITTVFLDRVVGLLMLITIGGVAFVVNLDWIQQEPELLGLGYFILVVLGSSFLGSLIFFNDRIRAHAGTQRFLKRLPFQGPLNRVQAAVYVYKHQPVTVSVALGLSLVVHSFLILSCLCYALSLGDLGDSAMKFFFIVPLAHLVLSLPFAPGGLGWGEAAYVAFFGLAEYDHGAVIIVLQRLSWYLWSVVGLVFYFLKKKKIRQAIDLAKASERESGACGAIPEGSGTRTAAGEKGTGGE